MGLHVHRAERADGLAEGLGAVLRVPLADPLQPEIVGVPTRGVERWLAQRLSAAVGTTVGRADGVCANVEFPFPGRLVGGAVARAAAVDPELDPWAPARSVWPLLDVVEAALAEPWLRELAAHLGGTGDAADPARRTRRLAAVRHLADLFDRYAVHRPSLVRAWAAGEDDGWQARLWRALRERLDVASPAERLEAAAARLRAEPELLDLPARLSLFGLTRLPASYLDVLAALAAGRDVHLFLLHPSAELWRRVDEALAGRPPVARRADDPTAHLPRNPLLGSWGRDAREMQLVVAARDGGATTPPHRVVAATPSTLLGHLQAAVRADRAPEPLPTLDTGDRSLQVHACHGRARQVEVVRDAVLHLLADDETLEPRDIVVMCPDIERFAPLVHATFGAAPDEDDGEDGDSPGPRRVDLRVRLADRSLRQTNPLLGVVAALLELADGRLTASQVLDLASRPPVRRRFRLDDDDLARVAQWAAEAGVRWGLDAPQRAPFKLERLGANTWQAGWDRVLLGVAMAEQGQHLLGGVLPLDDVSSGEIDLAGRVAELLDRLRACVDAFATAMPIDAWAAAIADVADALADLAPRDAWQRAQLARLLEDVVAEATLDGTPSATPLTLAEIRSLLADRLRGRPTRASFRTGHLTMCTLVPMRSVPHRVVCLMGLDDDVFPRQTARDGDDLLLGDPHVGDRDARTEDRQLLLDALLAATDTLVVTYTGRDERTNVRRPPAVPIGELLDVVDRTAPGGRACVVVEHPLQPFDTRNYVPGALVADRPWSFDPVALDGALALAGERSERPPFLAGPLPPVPAPVVELDELVRFVQHPARAFLRQRLGISVREADDEVSDGLPVDLDPLEMWSVGQRVLDARLAGADLDRCLDAEVARGALPPGRLAERAIRTISRVVEELVASAARELPPDAEPASLDVRLDLGSGRALVGTVAGVRGETLALVTYSRLAPKHRLAQWVQLLVLSLAEPERPFDAVTIGRARHGAAREATASVARLRLPLGPDERATLARRELDRLLDLHERGRREPVPVACVTSAAWASAVRAGGDPRAAADAVWTSGHERPREDQEAEHRLVLGGIAPLARLLEAAPRADEQGEGWPEDEPTRFGRYARRLWQALLEHEELGDR